VSGAAHRAFAGVLPLLVATGCKGANGAAIGEAATAVAVGAAASVIEAAASGPSESSYSASADDPNAALPSAPHVIDVEHARATLLLTDLAPCWPANVAHGPGYVEVTFQWNGTVTHVGVLRAREGGQLDAACVAQRLVDTIIDPFQGDPVVVRVTYGVPVEPAVARAPAGV